MNADEVFRLINHHSAPELEGKIISMMTSGGSFEAFMIRYQFISTNTHVTPSTFEAALLKEGLSKHPQSTWTMGSGRMLDREHFIAISVHFPDTRKIEIEISTNLGLPRLRKCTDVNEARTLVIQTQVRICETVRDINNMLERIFGK